MVQIWLRIMPGALLAGFESLKGISLIAFFFLCFAIDVV